MKYLTILIFLFISNGLFATEQALDRLIYKGDTILIDKFPLVEIWEKDSLLQKRISEKQDCFTTSCWREHIGIWKIENDSLFLVGLKDCCEYDEIPLTEVFDKDILKDGKVFAGWYTDRIRAGFGKFLEFDEEKWEDKYEHQIEIEFKNGKVLKLKSTKNY